MATISLFTGTRSAYVYTNDDGTTEYIIELNDLLASVTGTDLEDYTGQAGAFPKPDRFEPRCVYWESDDKVYRKKIVCGTTDSALYKPTTSQAVTVNGVSGKTTGRVGEKITFLKKKTVET